MSLQNEMEIECDSGVNRIFSFSILFHLIYISIAYNLIMNLDWYFYININFYICLISKIDCFANILIVKLNNLFRNFYMQLLN